MRRRVEVSFAPLATWRVLHSLLRIPALPLVLMLPLLGTAGLASKPTGLQVLMLLCVGINFHIFGFVLNDFIDLPVDRTQPLRSNDPLVRSAIRPWQALFVALIQVPIALALTFVMTGNGVALLVLGISFSFMSIYDIWGKRCFFPPLTDLLQGLAFGTLVLYGAIVSEHSSVTTITWVVAVFMVVFTVMGNGVHASLRDLSNDLKHHRQTTALLLGARSGEHGIIIPLPMLLYAFLLQVLLTGILLIPLANNSFGYSWSTWYLITSAVVALMFLSLAWPMWSVRSKRGSKPGVPQLIYTGLLHLGLLLVALLVICAPLLQPTVLALLIAIYLMPLFTLRRLRQRVPRRESKPAIRS